MRKLLLDHRDFNRPLRPYSAFSNGTVAADRDIPQAAHPAFLIQVTEAIGASQMRAFHLGKDCQLTGGQVN
jgi:hypothetical protein